jgi:hypothetical protein
MIGLRSSPSSTALTKRWFHKNIRIGIGQVFQNRAAFQGSYTGPFVTKAHAIEMTAWTLVAEANVANGQKKRERYTGDEIVSCTYRRLINQEIVERFSIGSCGLIR